VAMSSTERSQRSRAKQRAEAQANGHPFPTATDRRNEVIRILRSPDVERLTNPEIARRAGVTGQTVINIRRRLASEPQPIADDAAAKSRDLVPQVFVRSDGDLVTTSLNVAEVFGKDHNNVLRDIDELLAASSNLSPPPNSPDIREWFRESSYIGENGQRERMVEMTRDGFAPLAMGFTGLKAMQFTVDQHANRD
jgi:Rha family phage regulatory protein